MFIQGKLRPAILVLTIAAGVALFCVSEFVLRIPTLHLVRSLSFVLGALVVASAKSTRAVAESILALVRRCGRKHAFWLGAGVAICTSLYLFEAAILSNRPLEPRLHDEKSYVVQSRMLAHGMLWRAPHPFQHAFETFFVFNEPVYGSKYFPGAMMLYVPGVWLGLPDWITSLIIAGAVSAMACLITLELMPGDGVAGITASLLLLSVDSFHELGTWILSHEPMMLGALLMVYTWLRWRLAFRRRWAFALGAASGWAAITRPIDLLAYAIVLGVLVLTDLGIRFRRDSKRRSLSDLFIITIAASPFLLLQLIFNFGVTGHLFETPYRMYIDRYQPGTAFGAFSHSAMQPDTSLQQKLDFYNYFVAPMVQSYRQHGPWQFLWHVRIPQTILHGMSNAIYLVLIPAGIVAALCDRRLWLMAAAAPIFLGVYILNPYLIWYYPIIVAPAIAITIVAGGGLLLRLIPIGWQPFLRVFIPLAIAGVAVGSIPELFGDTTRFFPIVPVPYVEHLIQASVSPPALVFIHYSPALRDVHTEPVYALTTGWPDDEPIERAQDLGPEENAKLIHYYAKLHPDGRVFMFDRAQDSGRLLGRAAELAAKSPSATVPTSR